MQEHFLFDDDDPKQRGYGCDRMGSRTDGLKLKWHWWRFDDEKNRNKPSQVCLANLGNFWFEVIFWHTTFEARLLMVDKHLLSEGHGDHRDGSDKILTRLDAQKRAEGLLAKHIRYCNNMKKEAKL